MALYVLFLSVTDALIWADPTGGFATAGHAATLSRLQISLAADRHLWDTLLVTVAIPMGYGPPELPLLLKGQASCLAFRLRSLGVTA